MAGNLERLKQRIPLLEYLQRHNWKPCRAGSRQEFLCRDPHRLRHTFASEMLRIGVSLPALMRLLGYKDIRMTLRHVQVTQQDLQRELHTARQHATRPHQAPVLSVPNCPTSADPPGIRQAIAATRHLLEMYRRGLADEKTRRRLQRLDQRLLKAALPLDHIITPQK
jgi:hypothetical protein